MLLVQKMLLKNLRKQMAYSAVLDVLNNRRIKEERIVPHRGDVRKMKITIQKQQPNWFEE